MFLFKGLARRLTQRNTSPIGHHIDPASAALIEKLALQDLASEARAAQRKSRFNTPLTDPYQLHSESFNNSRLSGPSGAEHAHDGLDAPRATVDAAFIDAAIDAETAAADDRRMAIMLSRGEALPPPTASQARVGKARPAVPDAKGKGKAKADYRDAEFGLLDRVADTDESLDVDATFRARLRTDRTGANGSSSSAHVRQSAKWKPSPRADGVLPVTDGEYAYQLQLECFQNLHSVSSDAEYARSLEAAMATESDATFLKAPPTTSQARVERPTLRIHPKPPAAPDTKGKGKAKENYIYLSDSDSATDSVQDDLDLAKFRSRRTGSAAENGSSSRAHWQGAVWEPSGIIPLTDEEYAYQLQIESIESMLSVSSDAEYARSLDAALTTDAAFLEADIAAEAAAAEDRRMAIRLSGGEALPAPNAKGKAKAKGFVGSGQAPVQIQVPPATTRISGRSGTAADDTFPPAITDITPWLKYPAEPISPFQSRSARPAYARDFWWADYNGEPQRLTLVAQTLTLPPLQREPQRVLALAPMTSTLTNYPELFPIRTPIKVGRFERMLEGHPNAAFADSVVEGLRNGFWPWCDPGSARIPYNLDVEEYRLTRDNRVLAIQQCDEEVRVGRYTEITPFGLLPGMMAVPVYVKPKSNGKIRLIADQSGGELARNWWIDKSKVSVQLDGIPALAEALIRLRSSGEARPLTLFKSDVKEAYRLMPMAATFQMWQVIKCAGRYFIDHNNNFGGRASGGIWGGFFGLVLWIACYVKNLADLFAWVDDTFSYEYADNMKWYPPFSKLMPAKQVDLLLLWDHLGVPHKEDKQLFGAELEIIGFLIKVNEMSAEMSPERRDKLITALENFAVPGRQPTLREYQALAGLVNWALNVYPHLRPCLCALYEAIAHEEDAAAEIRVNEQIALELRWAANHLRTCSGVFFMDSMEWSLSDAQYTLLSHSCPTGLGFWSPTHLTGFQAFIPPTAHDHNTAYWDAYAVLCAFMWAIATSPIPVSRMVIYSDNSSAVQLFSTLRAGPEINPIAITAADVMLRSGCKLRVVHIAKKQNIVADALSQFDNDTARERAPGIDIKPFQPPQLTLGDDLL